MNVENLKRNGARHALILEAADIRRRLQDLEDRFEWYKAEQLTKDLQVLYTELLADSKQS